MGEECDEVSGSGCAKRGCPEGGPSDGSCADECCKIHDACCGSSDRTGCNNVIISCLEACPQGPIGPGKTCMRGDIPVAVAVIKTAMELDPYGCCGTSCNYFGAPPNNVSTQVVV